MLTVETIARVRREHRNERRSDTGRHAAIYFLGLQPQSGCGLRNRPQVTNPGREIRVRIPINPATHSDLKAATHSDTNPATHSDLKAARGQLPNRSVTVIAWQGF